MFPAVLFSAVQCSAIYPWHSGPWEPAGSRSSLRPLSIEGEATKQSSGEMSRERAKVCLQLKIEIQHCYEPHSVIVTLRACEAFDGATCMGVRGVLFWRQASALGADLGGALESVALQDVVGQGVP